jgi:hypothetical protein
MGVQTRMELPMCFMFFKKESRQLASTQGDDPRMRLEGFLADLVSTLINDNGRGDVETR